ETGSSKTHCGETGSGGERRQSEEAGRGQTGQGGGEERVAACSQAGEESGARAEGLEIQQEVARALHPTHARQTRLRKHVRHARGPSDACRSESDACAVPVSDAVSREDRQAGARSRSDGSARAYAS